MRCLVGHCMIRRARSSSLSIPTLTVQLQLLVRPFRGKHTNTISARRIRIPKAKKENIQRGSNPKTAREDKDSLGRFEIEDLGLSRRIYIPINTGLSSLRISIVGKATVISAESKSESKEMPKASYYAVAQGRQKGIYTTWKECEDQVKGYPAAKFKKFPSEEQAKHYISSNSLSTSTNLHSSSSSSASTNHPVKSTTEKDTQFRSLSPATQSQASSLPPDLEIIAQKGYTFSRGPPHYLIVYTDGSARGNGKIGSRAGAGVWWGSSGDAATRNISERVPGMPQTNNRGELLAVIRALEQCPYPDIPLEIRCDSQYTISCVTVWLPKWLSTNFKTSSSSSSSSYNNNNNNKNGQGGGRASRTKESTSKQVMNVDMIKHLLVLLRRRGSKGRVKFKYVPAHTGVQGNECADRLANIGAMMPPMEARTYWLDPDVPDSRAETQQGVNADDSTTTAAAAIPSASGTSREVTEIEVEMDENWLMTPEELAAFERGFESE